MAIKCSRCGRETETVSKPDAYPGEKLCWACYQELFIDGARWTAAHLAWVVRRLGQNVSRAMRAPAW